MKESNWQTQQRQDKLRLAQKRFSYPYPQIVPAKQSPANLSFHKKQLALLDKENFRTMDLRLDRKKTISPERKKPSGTKRRIKRNQHNQLGELNKTQELRRMAPGKAIRVPSSGSHPDFVKGKSAESKRQRRLEWEDREHREFSLSLKKRSLSKELRRIICQDHRERFKPKRPATQLTKQNVTLKPDNAPLMRDILKQIKKQYDNVRPRKESLVDSKKLKKDRRKSIQINQPGKNIQNLHLTKTVNSTSSKQKIKKKRISTVIQDIRDLPNSESQIYRQSKESNNIANSDLGEIQQVMLTQAEEFDLNEFRQFENGYFAGGLHKHQRGRNPSSELLDRMARKIQRWWRRLLTKKIVSHFVRFTNHTSSPPLSDRFARTESAQSQLMKKQEGEQLRFHEDDMRKVTHISNLSNQEQREQSPGIAVVQQEDISHPQSESVSRFDSVIHQMKQKELQKLNSFINMIKEQLERSNKAETEDLLKRLVQQSEFNCRSLEKEAEYALATRNEDKQHNGQQNQSPENYEEIDQDYLSKGAKSEEEATSQLQPQQIKQSPRVTMVRETKDSKRPITPSLENYEKKSQEEHSEKHSQSSQPLSIDNRAKLNLLPITAPVRQKLVFDKTSPSHSLQKSENTHSLNSYSSATPQDDPLAGLQAAQRLRKKLQQLNNRTFTLESESGLLYNNSDQEQQSPPLKRQLNPPLHRVSHQREVQIHDSSDSSGQWETFPKLEKLMKRLPDKDRLSDDTTHVLFTHLITEFLREVGSSSMADLFKSYAMKIQDKDKKLITIKKAVYRKTKGIKTNVAAVKEFLKGFNMFIIEKRPEVLERLREPAGPSAKELLKYMHPYDDDSESEDDVGMLVLPVQLFDEYWLEFENNFMVHSADQTELERSQQDYLRRLTNIHCRAVFDCFNQGLNFERNYGEFGKPFPWKSVPNFDIKPVLSNYKVKLENAYLRTIEMATSYCGIIFDKQDAPSAVMPTREQMQQMHEDRLSRTLALELFEMERNWLFYDDQETEILVELGQKVFDYVMRECHNELLRLFRLRALG